MLFLLNDRVLDLGHPAEALAACGAADGARLSLAQIVALGQEAAFASNDFRTGHADVGLAIAARIAVASEANCALFVTPARARRPRDVGVQLGYASLLTMAQLLSAQEGRRLSPGLINAEVWLAQAPAPA